MIKIRPPRRREQTCLVQLERERDNNMCVVWVGGGRGKTDFENFFS